MNKRIFPFLVFGMVVCAVSSCSKEDDSADSGAPGVPSGTLVGDDATANAAVADLRISSVGSYHYSYDEDGKLETISKGNNWNTSAENHFKIIYEDSYTNATFTFNIKSNHITALSVKGTYNSPSESSTENGQANFSYNAHGQLAFISQSYTATYVYDDDRYTESDKSAITFTYSEDHRLLSINERYDYDEGDGEKGYLIITHTYDYSSSYQNLFYQYTSDLFSDIDLFRYGFDIDALKSLESLAFVGLFGKASSYIPSKCTVESTEYYEGSKFPSVYTNSYSCSFNPDGTIARADVYNYSYFHQTTTDENADTRAILTSEPISTIQTERKPHQGFMSRLRERRHRL